MIIVVLDMDPPEARVRLRAHAYAHDMTAAEVAWQTVEPRLSLDSPDWRDSKPGTGRDLRVRPGRRNEPDRARRHAGVGVAGRRPGRWRGRRRAADDLTGQCARLLDVAPAKLLFADEQGVLHVLAASSGTATCAARVLEQAKGVLVQQGRL